MTEAALPGEDGRASQIALDEAVLFRIVPPGSPSLPPLPHRNACKTFGHSPPVPTREGQGKKKLAERQEG